MRQTAIGDFRVELARLRALYITSTHTFEFAGSEILAEIRLGTISRDAPFVLNPDDPARSLSLYNPQTFVQRLHGQYARYLRETILVRMVSALEVFLVQTIKEVFLERRDLFHADTTITIPVRQLLSTTRVSDLWSKLVSDEARSLQSQGFRKIVDFMSSRLKLGLTNPPVPIARLIELHDRRHLLVHRLGRVDDAYARRHGAGHATVTITAHELVGWFADLLLFGEYVAEKAEAVRNAVSATIRSVDDAAAGNLEATLELLTPEGNRFIDPEFTYSSYDRVFCLRDILLESRACDGRHYIHARGEPMRVKRYLTMLRRGERNDHLRVCELSTSWPEALRTREIDRALMEAVARMIPSVPWPKRYEKVVAQRFGLSHTVAGTVLNKIWHDPSLRAILPSPKGNSA